MTINRHPRGTTDGGRFAPTQRGEASLGLSAVPAGPAAPVIDRMSRAMSMRPGAAAEALQDPSPIVRVSALNGWDLSDEQVDEAMQDLEVSLIMDRISA